jgi:hypothetical protein
MADKLNVTVDEANRKVTVGFAVGAVVRQNIIRDQIWGDSLSPQLEREHELGQDLL